MFYQIIVLICFCARYILGAYIHAMKKEVYDITW